MARAAPRGSVRRTAERKTAARGLVVPGDGRNSENWSSEDKFAVVLETAALNEAELAEYCRKKGFFAEQVVAWKELPSSQYLSRSAIPNWHLVN